MKIYSKAASSAVKYYSGTIGVSLVSDFFLEYGLFVAKLASIVLVVGLGFVFILALAGSRTNKADAELEVDNVNDQLEDWQDTLEAEILNKDEYKALQKERRRKERAEQKARKKRSKKKKIDDEPFKPRLFVLRFDGDMHASEVDNLRQVVTAVLSVAKDADEVLMVLESPGGVVHSYGLAASQLARLREREVKLTVAVDLVAASGGYMMACVANRIIAAPFALLGSIGVLAEVPNFHGLLKRHDIDVEHHTAGEYKTTLTMLAKNTNKGRAKFREELEDVHKLFKAFVHTYRPKLNLSKVATGEAWYGSDALALGLIDEIKTSDDYIVELSETHDIFEVNFIVNTKFTEKLSGLLSRAMHGALEKFWYKNGSRFNFTR